MSWLTIGTIRKLVAKVQVSWLASEADSLPLIPGSGNFCKKFFSDDWSGLDIQKENLEDKKLNSLRPLKNGKLLIEDHNTSLIPNYRLTVQVLYNSLENVIKEKQQKNGRN